MTYHITIDEAKLKDYIKQRALQIVSQNYNGFTHTNRDKNYSPAQWDCNEARTVRHSLNTSGLIEAINNAIVITLVYEIVDISPK